MKRFRACSNQVLPRFQLQKIYLHIFGDNEDGTNILAANTVQLNKIVVTEFSHNLEEVCQNYERKRETTSIPLLLQ